MFRLTLIFGVLCLSPAFASTGECTFETPELIGPWTDGQDPACGDDCSIHESESEPTKCEDEEADCVIQERPLLDLRIPKPEGPRCLEPSPWCTTDTGPVLAAGKLLSITPPLPRPPELRIRLVVSVMEGVLRCPQHQC